MDDRVRTALRDLVASQGESLLTSRDRLRGMLSDDCPGCTKEINVLTIAVQAQVPAELRAYSSVMDTRVAVNAGILRLERAFGLGRPAAAWAVLSLAYAVGRIPDEQFPALLAELSVDSSAPQPEPSPHPTPPPPRPSPPPPVPVPVPRAKFNWKGLGVTGVVLLAVIVVYFLTHPSPAPVTPPSQSQPPAQSQPPPPDPPAPQPAKPQPTLPAGFINYADASGLFQLAVPEDWVSKRAEADITLDNNPCHLIHAVISARQAERAQLDGWVSEGIRVSIYLPPNGQTWPSDWATNWQKKTILDTLAGYTKYQNTAIEPVQLGNIPASTSAVIGEASVISEPEIGRIYSSTSPKFLVTVEVAMPSSKRTVFESVDDTVRRTFAINVP